MGVIRKQGIANTLISYIGILIGFINIIYVQPNFLSSEEVGLLRILFSFSATIAMFLPLGVGNITLKYFPYFRNQENGHHGIMGLIFLFSIIGSVIVGIVLLIFKEAFISLYSKDSALFVQYFYLVFPITISIAFCSLFGIYSQSLYKSVIPSFINEIALRIFNIGVIVIYFFGYIEITMMVILFFASYTLQALTLLLYIYNNDKPSLKINFKKIKEIGTAEILTYGFILSINSIASLSIKYIDVMMLGAFVPLSLVGVYSIAAFIPTVIEAPVISFERIANAKIANEWHQNNLTELFKIYQTSCKYLLFIGGYLFSGIIICSPYLFELLPEEYREAKNIVPIIAMGSLFNMTTGLNGSLIFTSKGYKYGTSFLIILVGVIISLNYILIPKYGIYGAAIANAIVSLIYNFLKFMFLWVKYKFQPFTKQTLLNLMVIITVIAAFKLIPQIENAYLGILLLGSGITVLYLALCYKLNLIEEELLNNLKSRLGIRARK